MKKFLFVMVAMATVCLVSCDKKNNEKDPYEGKTNPSTICESNLIAYFPFDGACTETINNIEPNKTGKGLAFEKGRRSQAYMGAANNELCYDATAIKGVTSLKDWTFACWLKHAAVPQSSAPTPFFFGLTDKDAFWGHIAFCLDRGGMDNTDSLAVKVAINGDMWAVPGLGNADIVADRWAHVVASFKVVNDTLQTLDMYVNGAPVEKLHFEFANRPETDFSKVNTLIFGQWRQKIYDGATDAWMGDMNGDIDEFRLYNTALSASEAKQLYDAEVSVIE